MTKYVITRSRDRTEWAMSEVGNEKTDIYIAVDGTAMMAVLSFEAPSWEDAKRVLEWSYGLPRSSKGEKTWAEVQALLEVT